MKFLVLLSLLLLLSCSASLESQCKQIGKVAEQTPPFKDKTIDEPLTATIKTNADFEAIAAYWNERSTKMQGLAIANPQLKTLQQQLVAAYLAQSNNYTAIATATKDLESAGKFNSPQAEVLAKKQLQASNKKAAGNSKEIITIYADLDKLCHKSNR